MTDQQVIDQIQKLKEITSFFNRPPNEFLADNVDDWSEKMGRWVAEAIKAADKDLLFRTLDEVERTHYLLTFIRNDLMPRYEGAVVAIRSVLYAAVAD